MAAGIHDLHLERIFASARQRIILSAPPYAPFAAQDAIRNALQTALAGTDTLMLTALDLPDAAPWMDELCAMLRPHASPGTMRAEVVASRRFLAELHRCFPQQVRRYGLGTRPVFPFLIIDDQIIFGHFAHAAVPTPQGFWGAVTAPVGDFLVHAESGAMPPHMPLRHLAALRIVSEYVHQLRHALPLP